MRYTQGVENVDNPLHAAKLERRRRRERERYATDPEYRAKKLEASSKRVDRWAKRKANDPTLLVRLNEQQRLRYATDPEFRQRKLEQGEKRQHRIANDPEFRAAVRARQRARHQVRVEDPEYRAKLAAQRRLREFARYGLTKAEADRLLEDQQGRCPGCLSELGAEFGPCVDHNHATGVVRGLLCLRCNWVLGLLDDDPARFDRLADYLRRAP